MFAAERRTKIKDLIFEYKHLTISSLAEMLQVTEATVRKDLETLEKEGVLFKMHGGAILNENYSASSTNQPFATNNPYSADGKLSSLHIKQEIAKIASMLISDNDVIFIGGGATCQCFAEAILTNASSASCTIVSNSLDVINTLSSSGNLRIISTGGELSVNDAFMSFSGPLTLSSVENIFFSKAFFSVASISLQHGYMSDNSSNMELLLKVMKHSSENYVLMDSSKFNKVSMLKMCTIEDIKNIVTDENTPDAYKIFFYEHNIRMYTTINYPSENL